MLFIKSKIQFFESKSQPTVDAGVWRFSCLSSQRYNFLKANHNRVLRFLWSPSVVYQVKDTIFWKQITTQQSGCWWEKGLFIKSKIQFFESKSQHNNQDADEKKGCLSSQRYNFLKAIHNKYCISISYTALRNGLEPLCAKGVLFLLL